MLSATYRLAVSAVSPCSVCCIALQCLLYRRAVFAVSVAPSADTLAFVRGEFTSRPPRDQVDWAAAHRADAARAGTLSFDEILRFFTAPRPHRGGVGGMGEGAAADELPLPVAELGELFSAFDANRDGRLSLDEFELLLAAVERRAAGASDYG